MRLTVAFTGLCRREDVLQATLGALTRYARNRVEVDVVISTWPDEQIKFEHALANHGIRPRFLINDPPLVELQYGRFFHQQTAMRAIGDSVSDGFVLRTRSDVLLTERIFQVIFGLVEQGLYRPQRTAYDVHGSLVWVPWADYEEPFHLADECFLTTRNEFSDLITFDIEGLARYGYPRANVHTLFYGRRFWSRYPAIDEFLLASKRSDLHFNVPNHLKFSVLSAAVERDEYLAYLALWWKLMLHNFVVKSTPQQEIDFYPGGSSHGAEWYQPRSVIHSRNFSDLFSSANAGFFNHFYLYDAEEFLERILTMDADPAGKRFLRVWAELDQWVFKPRDYWAEAWKDFFGQIARTIR